MTTNMAWSRGNTETGSKLGPEATMTRNINKLIITPPGYDEQLKRGHLIFDACFESGNLGRVDYITDFEYDLFIRPDTCNPRFRVWFNFTVENVKRYQRVIFNIVNFSKTKSLYRDGMSPVVKSTSRPKWQRLPSKNVYYYRCPDHRKNYVMSFAFCFDREDELYQFAYCYPYTYTRLQHYLENLDKQRLTHVHRELLGRSVQQRRLDLITITNPVNLMSEDEQRVVFITARVHPGETPSSFVCQGIIDFLVSQHPIAKGLRDQLIFKIAPMLNPDGVYLGNYRCSLMGFDLNRHWQDPFPWAHPTLYAVKKLVLGMHNSPKTILDFYIDIHAHSTMMNGFMYGNIFEQEDLFQRQAIFPKLLCGNAEDFSFSSTSFNRDTIKAGTGRRFLGGLLDGSSYCYTLEVSFYSYLVGRISSTTVPYTEEAYMKLGRNVARTFKDYYQLNSETSGLPRSQARRSIGSLVRKLGPRRRLLRWSSFDSPGGRTVSFTQPDLSRKRKRRDVCWNGDLPTKDTMEKRFSTPVRRSASCRSCRRYQQHTIASKSRSPSPYTNRRMCELSEDSRQRLAHLNLGPYAFKKELEDKPPFLVRHTALDGSLSPDSSLLSSSPGGNLSPQESSSVENRGKSKMFFPELSALESQRPSRSRDSQRMRIDELDMALGALNDPMPRETKRDAGSPKRTSLSRSAPSSIRRHPPSPVLNRATLRERSPKVHHVPAPSSRFQTARRKATKWEDLHNRIKNVLKTHRVPQLDLDNPDTWKTVYSSSKSGHKTAPRTKEKQTSPLRTPDTSVHLDKGEFWSNKASANKGKSHRSIFEDSMDKIYKNTYKKASSPRSHRHSPPS